MTEDRGDMNSAASWLRSAVSRNIFEKLKLSSPCAEFYSTVKSGHNHSMGNLGKIPHIQPVQVVGTLGTVVT